ncbi:hypothetical protein [Solemya velum gill symbiont]|uniref:Uncharacterized protein n=1 Tax=Solemya velum gill symbiont TaxID=2340 RepID=A0A0B0HAJ5_SOVGS|nr:hypothetical protein [Solemya velum gill symbiont]KHF24441.1 hypothetical protein JV46_25210 [Solemya velum gill symbiont]OOY34932.1 hypothetical protein BOV88_07375 [Solemya velum gill symbiont]OOY37315.1 hypothetical protein BOV89_07950 [Solemya velum gill symbiont]OOY40295.1 hypothetical protein BOV90_04760 [Solemya velum gill symbiont]OOY43728.1 hypothetical protein BOV92_10560 [Solemya velum gill symbiont]
MHPGYLSVETHPQHQGIIRFGKQLYAPKLPDGEAGGHICYLARFNDIDAAMMHIHEALRHQLVDLDNHRYRVKVADAIAAVKSRQLKQSETWIDPDLDDETMQSIDASIARYKQRQARFEELMKLVAKAAIVVLLAEAVMMTLFF